MSELGSRDLASPRRCLLVWCSASLVTTLLLGWLVPHLVATAASPPPTGRFEGWLVLGCEAAAVPAIGWLWLLVSLVTLEATGRRTRGPSGVPPALRRLVLAACGAGLVGGLAAPAYASTPPSPLAGLALPDRPTAHALPRPVGAAHPEPAAERRPARVEPVRTVRVAAGDSLWSLAAAELAPTADPADVDARWRALHDANRDVIGDDPDLIRPGQLLRLPPVTR